MTETNPRELVERLMDSAPDGSLALASFAERMLDRAEKAEAEVERLQSAIKRQAGAAATLRQITLAEVKNFTEMDRSNYIAPAVIEGEREANALLSAEIERLEAQLAAHPPEASLDYNVIPDTPEQRAHRARHNAEMRAKCPNMREMPEDAT
jgi:hypothetical protein